MTAGKGGRDLEVRIRHTPEGSIVRATSLGQPPQRTPPTFAAGIYEADSDDYVILAKDGQNPDHVLGILATMIIDRGTQWFAVAKPRLEVVPDDAGKEGTRAIDAPPEESEEPPETCPQDDENGCGHGTEGDDEPLADAEMAADEIERRLDELAVEAPDADGQPT